MKANGNRLNAGKGMQMGPTSSARQLKTKVSLHQGHIVIHYRSVQLAFSQPLEG